MANLPRFMQGTSASASRPAPSSNTSSAPFQSRNGPVGVKRPAAARDARENEELRTELAGLQKQVNRLEAEKAKLRGLCVEHEETLKKYVQDAGTTVSMYSADRDRVLQQQGTMEEKWAKEREQFEQALLARSEQRVRSLREKHAAEVDERDAIVTKLTTTSRAAQEKCEGLQETCSDLEAKVIALAGELMSKENALDEAAIQLRDAQAQLHQLQPKEAELSTAVEKSAELSDRVQELEAELATAHDDLAGVRKELQRLNEVQVELSCNASLMEKERDERMASERKAASAAETIGSQKAELEKELATVRRGLDETLTNLRLETAKGEQLRERLAEAKGMLADEKAQRQSTEAKLMVEVEALATEKARTAALRGECQEKEVRISVAEQTIAGLREDLERARSSHGQEKRSGQELMRMLEDAQAQLREKSARCDMLGRQNNGSAEKMAQMEDEIKELRQAKKDLETQVREGAAMRRKLHNEIQELKGNIRVYCRVRPLLNGAAAAALAAGNMVQLDNYTFPDGLTEMKTIVVKGLERQDVTSTRAVAKEIPPFQFDRVYGPNAAQDEVFEDISQLVQSALDGYRVCIFAYGQTGSGKTFTMEGPHGVMAEYTAATCAAAEDATMGFAAPSGASFGPGSKESRELGMIPRSVQQIFAYAQELALQGWRFKFVAQFVEIYNNDIRDLIAPTLAAAASTDHDIKMNPDGTNSVTNVTLVEVDSVEKVLRLMARANRNRATAETKMNERSSRSHSVFTLYLKGLQSESGVSTDGILNLIDLAGSERVDQSGATGDRFREAVQINKSLSALGDVIFHLGQMKTGGRGQQHHVPFRNSRLTHLLQPCLGKDCKTLMFVNISPEPAHVFESISSLRFAQKVNCVEVGSARRQATIQQ
eukprot:TRINITY_DN9412_c0_g1_i1.p1 TRINITY_DN9412_c0_g1~~TRINITY_DN9412_c0_g1_i1.p1  ORF type:complete len:888 (-),score=270.07 TRINITY_DN9412_c0_g1_i1:163-2826(-)